MTITIDYIKETATNNETGLTFPIVMSKGDWYISVGNLISLENAGLSRANFTYWENHEPYASKLKVRVLGSTERWVSVQGWSDMRIMALKRQVRMDKQTP